MSEKKTIRRHSATHHAMEFSRALWVFKTIAGGLGVDLYAHAVEHEHRHDGPKPHPMISVSLTMTPAQARELAQGLLAAADFYDKQSERLAAAREPA